MIKKLEHCRVLYKKKLTNVLRALERGGVGIALIVDEKEKLLGTMTDGDVRKALLSGSELQSPLEPYMQHSFTAVNMEARRAEVVELMQARIIEQVPIIDKRGKLVGLHLLHELLGRANRTNWGVILAGGRGSRLWPITEHIPKPMVRVAGRPIIERIVLHMVGHGIRRIFVTVNHLSHVIEQHLQDGSKFGCQIRYIREKKPLGTGGALSLLPKVPKDPLLVMNGDLVTQADLGALLSFHQQNKFTATVAVQPYSYTIPYGCVEVRGERVATFEEKPVIGRLINAGIYVLSPALIRKVPRNNSYPITALLEQCLSDGDSVGAFQMHDEWIDVGEPEQLRLAREGVTKRKGVEQ